MLNLKDKEKGFATSLVAILVLGIMFSIIISVSSVVFGGQKILQNVVKSSQSYYIAEAGVEDALLRLKQAPSSSAFSYNFSAASGSVNVTVGDIMGGSRVISAQGDISNRIKKVRVIYKISTTDDISFYYGVQVGDGGMVMGEKSAVNGNVFSNGSIIGANKATITNSVVVAGNSNKIDNIEVGKDANVYTCKDSKIGGTLYYVSGGSVGNCSYGTAVGGGPEIEAIPLPISPAQIFEWETVATAGGVIGSKTISGIESLGPVKIGGNLVVGNGATLKVNGTIYVTGNITLNQNSKVQLESSYGSLSGIIIADGNIIVENGTQVSGSGQAGSYILILSTKNDIVNPVIDVRNNALGAIFYANNGLIYLKNGMKAKEITGYKIQIENTAEVQYESGLQNPIFSNGPGGSWNVESWNESE